MFDSSDEFGHHQGLGLLPGKIVKLDVPLKIPHMGWNRLDIQKQAPLFNNLPEEAYVYFVHSYYLETMQILSVHRHIMQSNSNSSSTRQYLCLTVSS